MVAWPERRWGRRCWFRAGSLGRSAGSRLGPAVCGVSRGEHVHRTAPCVLTQPGGAHRCCHEWAGMAALLPCWPWSRQQVSPGPTVPKAGCRHGVLQGLRPGGGLEPTFSASLCGARVSGPSVRLIFHLQLHPLLLPVSTHSRALVLRAQTHSR